MKRMFTMLAVKDVKVAQKFYQDLFNLKVVHDFGLNVSFNNGLALQQEIDWWLGLPKDKILEQSNNMALVYEEEYFDDFVAKVESYPGVRYVNEGVKTAEWGQRTLLIYDLDGHIIEIDEPLKNVIERFQNSGLTLEEVANRMMISKEDIEKVLLEGAVHEAVD